LLRGEVAAPFLSFPHPISQLILVVNQQKTTLYLSSSSSLHLGTDVQKGGTTPEELESRVQPMKEERTSSSGSSVLRKASSGALRTFQSRYYI
jgi:hypothetical protein